MSELAKAPEEFNLKNSSKVLMNSGAFSAILYKIGIGHSVRGHIALSVVGGATYYLIHRDERKAASDAIFSKSQSDVNDANTEKIKKETKGVELDNKYKALNNEKKALDNAKQKLDYEKFLREEEEKKKAIRAEKAKARAIVKAEKEAKEAIAKKKAISDNKPS